MSDSIIMDKHCASHPESGSVLVLTPDKRHYGRWNCEKCGKFITWAKTPRTNEMIKERQDEILEMVKSGLLTDEQYRIVLPLYTVAHLNLVQERQYTMVKQSLNQTSSVSDP